MGKAIIIPDVDFSGLGMGKVIFGGSINAPKVFVGESIQLTSDIDQATWSIEDDTVADINSSTGLLTIKPNAWGEEVLIYATNESVESGCVIKVFYNDVETAEFEECKIVDISNILRNGSPGNPGNTMRVTTSKTIAVDNYRELLSKTTKAPQEGYKIHTAISLFKESADTITGYQLVSICEYGVEAGINELYPAGKFLPLYEDSQNPYYGPKGKKGEVPISFAVTFDESTDGTYANDRAIRANDFIGQETKVALFK